VSGKSWSALTASVSVDTSACVSRFSLSHDLPKSAVVEFCLRLVLGLDSGEVDWSKLAFVMRREGYGRLERRTR
jgi:hypothetical protein